MDVCVLGSINLDNVCRVARLPAPGETLMAEAFERFAGGKGANQAVAAAAWGAATALIGALGQDEPAETLVSHLEGRGVAVSAVVRLASVPTGQAQICVSAAGENTIVVVGGANQAVTPAHVLAADTRGCKVFLTQLESPLAAVEALFTGPSAAQAIKILNAAPAVDGAQALFPLADVVVLNESELAFFAGTAEAADAPSAAARRLISRAGQTIIVTLGAAGALAVTLESQVFAAGRPASVADTTGAGDCFCGVLAAALAERLSLAEALTVANDAAALSTEQSGAAVTPTLRADAEARFSRSGGPVAQAPGLPPAR